MKKKLSLMAMFAVLAFATTGCGNDNSDGSNITSLVTTPEDTTTTVSEETTTEASVNTTEESVEESKAEEGSEELSAQSIFEQVKAAYGDTFTAQAPVTEDDLEPQFGVTKDMYDDFAGGIAMITIHPDKVLVVQAKPEKLPEVRKALEGTRDKLINDTLQYPMNIAKINATQIVEHGNYIMFILAGNPDDRDDATEDQRMEFALEQVQLGIDAFNNSFSE